MARNDALIRVEVAKGRWVKMYRQDAIAKGLIKARPQVSNKMVQPQANKEVEVGHSLIDIDEKDDDEMVMPFTDIPGIGATTAKKIEAQGIRNVQQLKYSNWTFLPKMAQNALQEYFNKGD